MSPSGHPFQDMLHVANALTMATITEEKPGGKIRIGYWESGAEDRLTAANNQLLQ
jgi:hypothetical protein